MFTKEQLLKASSVSIITGKKYKGVITSEEMQRKLDDGRVTVYTITCRHKDKQTFFFTDDYCFGFQVIPDQFVPSSTMIPHRVNPREGLPEGIVSNVKEFVRIYHNDEQQIHSIDELVDYLNEHFTEETA